MKLTAASVNNLAIGLAVTGGLAPIFAFLNGALAETIASWEIAATTLLCFAAASGIHVIPRRYLISELR